MTPADVAAMTLDQYAAFVEEQNAEIRAQNRAAQNAKGRRR